jgi:hypothetical protein
MRSALPVIKVLVFLAIVIPAHSFGTTVLCVFTPGAIVIGADGKAATVTGQAIVLSKVAIIQDRFTIATIGLMRRPPEVLRNPVTGDSYNFAGYDFPSWITSLKALVPKDVNIHKLSDIVRVESAKIFQNYDLLVKAGDFNSLILNYRGVGFPNLVTYLIVGYSEDGSPCFFDVDFSINNIPPYIIGPTVTPMPPGPNDGIFHAGEVDAIDEILGLQPGEAYTEAFRIVPGALTKYFGRQDLSIEEATQLIKAFIKIQSKRSPDKVGPPTSIVVIPKNGSATLTVYGD